MNRIREFRQARGWSLQTLADAAGTGKSQIDKLEKGARRLTVDWMVRLAKPLGCDPRDLMLPDAPELRFQPVKFGEARGVASKMIPVRALKPGKAHTRFAEGAVDYLPRPYYLAHAKDAYAVSVADDSMLPMYRARQLLFINPHKQPAAGGGVVAIMKSGAVTIRAFVRATKRGIVLREYGPRPRETTIMQKDIAGLHAVAGTVEG